MNKTTCKIDGCQWDIDPIVDPRTGESIGFEWKLNDPGRYVKWRADAYTMKSKLGVKLYRNETLFTTLRWSKGTLPLAKKLSNIIERHETNILSEAGGLAFGEAPDPEEEIVKVVERLLSREREAYRSLRTFRLNINRANGSVTTEETLHEAGLEGEYRAIQKLINSLGII